MFCVFFWGLFVSCEVTCYRDVGVPEVDKARELHIAPRGKIPPTFDFPHAPRSLPASGLPVDITQPPAHIFVSSVKCLLIYHCTQLKKNGVNVVPGSLVCVSTVERYEMLYFFSREELKVP